MYQVAKALEVFEWMVEGKGASSSIPADAQTYHTLVKACHQKAMLEKALEVMSWMINSGIEVNSDILDEVTHTVEIAQLWDEKAIKPATKVRMPTLLLNLPNKPICPTELFCFQNLDIVLKSSVELFVSVCSSLRFNT